MLRRTFHWLAIAGLLLNPVLAYATDIRVDGPIDSAKTLYIGRVPGKILKSNAEGFYVKVLNEDLKFENHRDPEILKIAEQYHDKDWDRWHVLLFIPRSAIAGQREPEKKTSESGAFQCYMQGKHQARSLSTSGSAMGGFAGGLFLGLIGTALAVAVQSDPTVPYYAIPEDEPCQMPFIQGFQEEGKSKKRNAALAGGVIGTLVLVGIVVAANSTN